MGKKNLPNVWKQQVAALSRENAWLRAMVDKLTDQAPSPIEVVEAMGKVVNPIFSPLPDATVAEPSSETFTYPDHEFDESLEPKSQWPREGQWSTAEQGNGSQAGTGAASTRNL